VSGHCRARQGAKDRWPQRLFLERGRSSPQLSPHQLWNLLPHQAKIYLPAASLLHEAKHYEWDLPVERFRREPLQSHWSKLRWTNVLDSHLWAAYFWALQERVDRTQWLPLEICRNLLMLQEGSWSSWKRCVGYLQNTSVWKGRAVLYHLPWQVLGNARRNDQDRWSFLSIVGIALQSCQYCLRRAEWCCSQETWFGGMVPRVWNLQRVGLLLELHWLPV